MKNSSSGSLSSLSNRPKGEIVQVNSVDGVNSHSSAFDRKMIPARKSPDYSQETVGSSSGKPDAKQVGSRGGKEFTTDVDKGDGYCK